jgi:hypothetical protein
LAKALNTFAQNIIDYWNDKAFIGTALAIQLKRGVRWSEPHLNRLLSESRIEIVPIRKEGSESLIGVGIDR